MGGLGGLGSPHQQTGERFDRAHQQIYFCVFSRVQFAALRFKFPCLSERCSYSKALVLSVDSLCLLVLSVSGVFPKKRMVLVMQFIVPLPGRSGTLAYPYLLEVVFKPTKANAKRSRRNNLIHNFSSHSRTGTWGLLFCLLQ